MIKKDLTKVFVDEIYSKAPEKNWETKKNIYIYNHIDGIWSIDLADMVDYKISNNKRFLYTFVIIDNFSKNTWCIPLTNKYGETITKEFLKMLASTSKRKPLKVESDRGEEWYNSVFQNFLKFKKTQHYSRFTEKGPSIAERVIRTVRNFLRKTSLWKR